MRPLLPLGLAVAVVGIAMVLAYEIWAVDLGRADVPAISDYLRLFIAAHGAMAVMLVLIIGLLLGMLVMHLWGPNPSS